MRRTVTPVSFSRSAMTGPSVWPSYGLPCSALACSANCPPLGAVTGVAIETLQPNSYGELGRASCRQGLGRVQRGDLWPTLTWLLMANPQREMEQRSKALCERCVAVDLGGNITDDAAKPRAQKLQFPPRAVELVYGLPCSALACSTNCLPLGAVTGVAIETLQPNSYG